MLEIELKRKYEFQWFQWGLWGLLGSHSWTTNRTGISAASNKRSLSRTLIHFYRDEEGGSGWLTWINCLTGNCWQEEKLHFGGSESIKRARQCPDVAAVAMIKRERREER